MAQPMSPWMIPDWQQPVMDPFSVQTPVPRPQLAMMDWGAAKQTPPPPSLPAAAMTPPRQRPAFQATPSGSPDPMSYEMLLAGIKEKGDALANDQRRSAQVYANQMQPLLEGDLQYDLSPLAALVDTWSGSSLAKSYKAPETGQERMEKVQGLQKSIADAGIRANATELEALKTMAEGQLNLEKVRSDKAYKDATLGIQRDQNNISLARLGMGGGARSEFRKSLDRKLGASYQSDVTDGGLRRANNEIANLDVLLTKARSGELGEISGPGIGLTPEGRIRGIFHPEAKRFQQDVEKAVQASMRETLGAQFTQVEGAQLLARTYDPTLPPEVNLYRLNIVIDGLKRAAENKKAMYRHLEEYGTSEGFKGLDNIEGDFLNYVNSSLAKTGGGGAGANDRKSKEERLRMLEAGGK